MRMVWDSLIKMFLILQNFLVKISDCHTLYLSRKTKIVYFFFTEIEQFVHQNVQFSMKMYSFSTTIYNVCVQSEISAQDINLQKFTHVFFNMLPSLPRQTKKQIKGYLVIVHAGSSSTTVPLASSLQENYQIPNRWLKYYMSESHVDRNYVPELLGVEV